MNLPGKISRNEDRLPTEVHRSDASNSDGVISSLKRFFGGNRQAKPPIVISTLNSPKKTPITLVADNTQKPSLSNDSTKYIKRIESLTELPLFSDTLVKRVGIAGELLHRIYPILINESEKTFALVAEEGEVQLEMFDSIKNRILDLGYRLAETWVYVAPYAQIFELSRNGARVVKAVAAVQNKSSSPLFILFENVAKFAIRFNASDIHFRINLQAMISPVEFCIDGKMVSPNEFMIKSSELLLCISYMYNNHGVEVSESVFNQNKSQGCNIPLRIQNKDWEFRFASQPLFNGILIVLRVTESQREKKQGEKKNTLESLGYLPDQIELIKLAVSKPKGGIVICGRVGSGKSTLQHTILSNIESHRSILTIEDPVENPLVNASQVTISRALVDEDESYDPFQAAKRQVKRLNQKVVAAGEIRDAATAEVFKDTVEAGLLSLCTIHCGSVVEALTMRLVSNQLGIGREVVATPEFLSLIVFQALVRTLCEHCKVPATEVYDDAYLSKLERLFDGLDRRTMYAANRCGCNKCRKPFSDVFNGFGKRIVVAETLRPDYGMLFLVRNNKNIEIAQRFNMLRDSATLADPDTKGKTALEVAMYHVHCGVIDPKEVEVELGSFDEYYLKKLEQINV